jgi:hypothetical protein
LERELVKKDRTKAAFQIDKAIRMFCDGVASMVADGDPNKNVGPQEWVQMYSIFLQSVDRLCEFWQGIVQESLGAKHEIFREETATEKVIV